MTAKLLSLAEICPSFGVEELFSPELIQKNCLHVADVQHLLRLQRFRDYVWSTYRVGLFCNYGVYRHRGCRSTQDQVVVVKLYGGAETASMHCAGKANDLTMTKDHNSDWLAQKALEFGFSGVGKYNSFVHCDSRTLYPGQVPAQWDLRSLKTV